MQSSTKYDTLVGYNVWLFKSVQSKPSSQTNQYRISEQENKLNIFDAGEIPFMSQMVAFTLSAQLQDAGKLAVSSLEDIFFSLLQGVLTYARLTRKKNTSDSPVLVSKITVEPAHL